LLSVARGRPGAIMPPMPRTKRMYTSGMVCHVLNRAVGRAEIFHSAADYAAFERVLAETCTAVPMRVLTFCLMPNHWHLVLWPQADRDLSVFMHRLTMTHTMRWHHARQTAGTGPLYQGRFKSFPVASDEHFFTVCRYVERNPLRANLVERAEDWRWSGLWHRSHPGNLLTLADWPLGPPNDWLHHVNQPHTVAELASLHASVQRGIPFGSEDWRRVTADHLGIRLESRSAGRPRKKSAESGMHS
jgi:putative transposase